jgi:hypothetical protein
MAKDFVEESSSGLKETKVGNFIIQYDPEK